MKRRFAVYVWAGALYLVISVVLWWHVWTTHPSTTMTCGCGDPALFLWYLAWPAYAMSHGATLLWSAQLFHPAGVNMLSNTSELAIGIPLAPVTWLFGPVVTLNVALTLSPVLSGLSALWLCRRWTTSPMAGIVGGLVFGFSPFILTSLMTAHLMTAALMLLPIIVGALDELLIRQKAPPVLVGLALAGAVTIEFFVSTEMLFIFALMGIAGLLVVVLATSIAHRRALVVHARKALPGIGVAAVASVALLAYPVWFALAGPAHLSGVLWKSIVIGGFTAGQFFWSSGGTSGTVATRLGGYGGFPLPSAAYIGIGMAAVLLLGLVLRRRDPRIWFFTVLGAGAAVLSLTIVFYPWQPWRLLYEKAIFDNVIIQRFVSVTTLCVAVVLALTLDAVHGALRGRWPRMAPVAVLVVAAAGLYQTVSVLIPEVPYSVMSVALPKWYAGAGRDGHGATVLAFPAPFSGVQSSMAWAAMDGFSFNLAGGGGPQGTRTRAGAEIDGFDVIGQLGFGVATTPPPAGTLTEFRAARRAMRAWGVTEVVVDRVPGAGWVAGRSARYAAGFMTGAIGRLPRRIDGAWVWQRPLLDDRPLRIGPHRLTRCARSGSVARCVMGPHRSRKLTS